MSLINRMLQDLEKTPHDTGDEPGLPDGVHAVREQKPAFGTDRRWPRWVLALLLSAGAGFGASHWLSAGAPPAPVPAAAASMAAPGIQLPAPEAAPAQPSAQAIVAPPAAQVPVATSAPAFAPSPASASAKPSAAPITAAEALASAGDVQIAEKPSKQKGRKGKERAAAADRDKRSARNKDAAPAITAVVVNPADVQYRQALEAYSIGRARQAAASAREALGVSPGHIPARQLLLSLLLEQGQRDEAMQIIAEGVRLHPEQTDWGRMLARLKLDAGDAKGAQAVVEQFLPRAGGDASFLAFAGALAQRLGRYGDAADHYRSALRLTPGDARSWVGLGVALEGEGHAPEAQEAYRRAQSVGGLDASLQAMIERKLAR